MIREELPCIWTLAGVLQYRLCDRGYACEDCELFHALRGRRSLSGMDSEDLGKPSGARPGPDLERAGEDLVGAYLSRLTAGCELHLDRPYCHSHFWLQQIDGDRVRLGLDGHLLRVLYPIDDITLPHVGVLLKRGEPCGWITRGRLAIPLEAPLSGEVDAVNQTYVDEVRRHGGPNGGEEWLLRLEAYEDIETAPGLYRGEDALLWHLRTLKLLKRYLREALATSQDSEVGLTLTDGGAANINVEQVLGREAFETLVGEMFHLQI
ncbi:MAG: hypothetical protein JSU87_04220 [Gemmatimonadota bacterium]|nr:MAG: hypothetical protein JSU87_04220 [Gemmatimonadota bacterium]